MSRNEWDVRCAWRSSCMERCMRTISRSSGVWRTVEAADSLIDFGGGTGSDCVRCFFVVMISSSFENERWHSADLMRLRHEIRK